MSTTIQINIPQDRTPSNNNIIRGEPPAYSEDNNNNNATASVNISSPTTAYLSPNSSSISTNPSSESLPSYDNANNDVPPLYPTDSLKLNSIVDPYYDLVPIEPQNPWPISKKFYIFGFLIWPLWYIGIPFGFFGKDQETKRWGRRCIFNAIILSAVFGYLIVAYYKSISHS
ncbi:hypothetical protein C1645_128801 [Glomus cerebriforme]|uniref:Uncharacterized protein n=1 Tax=Glomus cerebriforme TaxID=658196 RepID=A0A397S2N0_9GLOM|nr:hypothetical protein C1645_128801 [Glomus cerebriforme]